MSLLVVCGSAGAAEMKVGSAPSFTAAREYDTAKGGESVAIGDLNGDGKPDVVSAHGTPDEDELRAVSVLLNRGGGRLGPSKVYPTGKTGDELGAWSVAIGDLTGDGKPDLATANPGARSVSLLVGRGTGEFEPPVNYPIGRQPWDIAIADIDVDGKPDIATANPNTVSVLFNQGGGTFGDKAEYPTGTSTWAFVVRDLNGDGKPDLATTNNTSSTISVHINRGDRTFAPRVAYPTGPGPHTIATGDLNGDRQPDVVTANGTSSPGGDQDWVDSISVFLSRGDGTFRPARTYRQKRYTEPAVYISVRIGDMNGDRRPDLVTADGGLWRISVRLNRGSGKLGNRFDYGPLDDEDVGLGAEAVALGDLSGDRRLDVVTAHWDYVSVFINAPGLCDVPEVRWIKLAAAKRTLARTHCRLGRVRWKKRGPYGWVLSQRPAAGTVLRKGGKVNLVVSRGP